MSHWSSVVRKWSVSLASLGHMTQKIIFRCWYKCDEVFESKTKALIYLLFWEELEGHVTWAPFKRALNTFKEHRGGNHRLCLRCPGLCSHHPPWNYPEFTLNPGEWAGPCRSRHWCDSAPQTETEDPRLHVDYSRRDSIIIILSQYYSVEAR